MNRYRFKIMNQFTTEGEVEKFHEVADHFDASLKDDFMLYWISFMFFYPLTDQLQGVFDKMETDSQRLGILSRHLIKKAKEIEIPQHMIDEYVKAKKQSKRWKDFYTERIEDKKENLSEIQPVVGDHRWLRDGFNICEDIGKYKERKRQQRTMLHKTTFGLITKLINHRINR